MTQNYVKWFEQEQAQYGTRVALANLVTDLGFSLIKMGDTQVTGISLRRARVPAAKKTTKKTASKRTRTR